MNDLTGLYILSCWAIFAFYWLVASFAVKRTVESRGWAWRILVFGVVLAAFLLLRSGGTLPMYLGMLVVPQTLPAGLIADGVTTLGLALAFWARRTLGSNWSGEIALKENHELVERGPYHYVRHPIYSGLVLMFLGTALWYGRVGGFAACLVVFILFWARAFQEEQLLTNHFPDAYPSYKKRVKALVPFLV